jgi:hypothetical protein
LRETIPRSCARSGHGVQHTTVRAKSLMSCIYGHAWSRTGFAEVWYGAVCDNIRMLFPSSTLARLV